MVGMYSLVLTQYQALVRITTLHYDLRSYLSDYEITSLHHARNTLVDSQAYWLSANDLELGSEWKIEWDSYISGLQQGGRVPALDF